MLLLLGGGVVLLLLGGGVELDLGPHSHGQQYCGKLNLGTVHFWSKSVMKRRSLFSSAVNSPKVPSSLFLFCATCWSKI